MPLLYRGRRVKKLFELKNVRGVKPAWNSVQRFSALMKMKKKQR